MPYACMYNMIHKVGLTNTDDTICVFSTEPQSPKHLLRCLLLEQECKADDLVANNDIALSCDQLWLKYII